MSLEQKKIFALNAILVWLVTEISLQIFLFYLSISIATLLSQLIYVVLGFFRYSKAVFKIKIIKNNNIFRFLIMSLILWAINYIGIYSINLLGLSKNLAAILMIPFLAFLSFIIQKKYVFK